jgi:hypothetical protein
MDQYIPGTTNKWSDWCGCHQGTQFYDKWREKEYKKWRDQGIDPEIVLPQISEKCTYPHCKSSIKTYNQTQEPDCPQCVQLRFDDWSDTIVNVDKSSIINTGQELNCGDVAKDIEDALNENKDGTNSEETNGRETDELKGKNTTQIKLWKPDDFNITTEEGQINVGILVSIIIGTVFFLSIFGRLIYVKINYGKFRFRIPRA